MTAHSDSPDQRGAPPAADARRLFGLARGYLGGLLLATLMMLIGGAIGLATPLVAGRVVDAALVDSDSGALNRIVLGLLGLFAALGIVAFLEHWLIRRTGARLLLDLRTRVFDHLLTLSPVYFNERPTGELLSRLGTDLTLVQASLTRQIPGGIQALLRFAGTLIILLVIQTRLTLVALVVVPPVVLVAIYYGRRLEKLSREERDATADAGARSEETLAGIRTVQAFQQESSESGAYAAHLASLLGIQFRNAKVEGAFGGMVQFSAFSAFAVVLWYGGRLMLEGQLTPGELTSFLLYTFSIAVSVGTLGALYAALRELRGASARIFEILDTRSDIADGSQTLQSCEGRIEIEKLDFEYASSGRPALRDLSFSVSPGETIGLVGPSGSGKSTLFSLLLRFYDPTRGSLRIDGHELRDLRLADLRRQIGIVPQDIFLHSGTVAENLRFGDPLASDARLEEAAARAGALEFIEQLGEGFQTRVGQRGIRLSGGERQRLAIARAFLRDPRILLLDEATSALDPDSERIVARALAELMQDRTTLVIAHRLVTARRADRILVLEDGHIVGAGTHDQLFASNELYARYWTLQSLEDLEPALEDPEPNH
ncbi:ABC transporter ATP-binding protein [bacterium]|nr:MAG: ABC transporter ATP-binding protein [bacterium]